MRRRRLFSPSEEGPTEPLINLTPLIDVVFVVLISFILIAPFLKIDSIILAPGIKEHASASTPPTLTIAIHADDSLWVNHQQISFSDLEPILRKLKKESPSSTPQLIPDARSHFANYQRVKNTLENVGFTEMQILLKEPD
ncbi:MAG TPA: biopolymer transporter ExbD [Chlamydiales bacterium]|nr:MAG: hypothetical protein A3F67_03745 [Verrucomicrobia bacterium RIFCSPHIGHO2_12_FULL_41_10]HLB53073.1 biopolymer transporter ExbD [Chlamydiales bacterium]